MPITSKSRQIITIISLLIFSFIGVFFITANEMPKYRSFMIFFILLILPIFTYGTVSKAFSINKLNY